MEPGADTNQPETRNDQAGPAPAHEGKARRTSTRKTDVHKTGASAGDECLIVLRREGQGEGQREDQQEEMQESQRDGQHACRIDWQGKARHLPDPAPGQYAWMSEYSGAAEAKSLAEQTGLCVLALPALAGLWSDEMPATFRRPPGRTRSRFPARSGVKIG